MVEDMEQMRDNWLIYNILKTAVKRSLVWELQREILSDWESRLIGKGFQPEEFKTVVFELPRDKAPGPDGFSMFFFQECRETIRDDLFSFFS